MRYSYTLELCEKNVLDVHWRVVCIYIKRGHDRADQLYFGDQTEWTDTKTYSQLELVQ